MTRIHLRGIREVMPVPDNQFTIRIPKRDAQRAYSLIDALGSTAMVAPQKGDVLREIFLQGLRVMEARLREQLEPPKADAPMTPAPEVDAVDPLAGWDGQE